MAIFLETFDNRTFDKNAGWWKRLLWLYVNALFFKSSLFPMMRFKKWLLVAFGAKVGAGLVIKPSVHIKFPWKLELGNHVWLGEHVWIDNLDRVRIGNNVCLSQGALLLTGNHDYTLSSFDFRNAPIVLEDGVWIGAKAVVCPGVRCRSHAILTVGSVATGELAPYVIYQGNPARPIRKRIFKEETTKTSESPIEDQLVF